MKSSPDRLYELLPAIYRIRDADAGEPLRALLQVIAEQANMIETDIDQLYRNWFIETCDDWVVPYIADLIGYQPVDAAGRIAGVNGRDQRLNATLTPRREVANTIDYRRRKGTLALLEQLAADIAGWPARAVEFYPLIATTHHLNHRHPERGGTLDLRSGDTLDRINGPFDQAAHTVDVRRPNASLTRGRHDIASIGLFVWPVQSYSITQAPAYTNDRYSRQYCFSTLGNDVQLLTLPVQAADDGAIARQLSVPAVIRRRALRDHLRDYYGSGKSFTIWRGGEREPVLVEQIVAANLADWSFYPRGEQVAVDPELGRIAFSEDLPPPDGVWVSYHYGFSADLGGGEYERQPRELASEHYYRVGKDIVYSGLRCLLADWQALGLSPDSYERLPENLSGWWNNRYERLWEELAQWWEQGLPSDIYDIIGEALNELPHHGLPDMNIIKPLREKLDRLRLTNPYGTPQRALTDWRRREPQPSDIVVELIDSGDYSQPLRVSLQAGQHLTLQAAQHRRPLMRVPNDEINNRDALRIQGPAHRDASGQGARLTLDGLLIAGRSLYISGAFDEVTIRHCTLLPGWWLRSNNEPFRGVAPSLDLTGDIARLTIEQSIVGTIWLAHDAVELEPMRISISDSILDATAPNLDALGQERRSVAHALLTITRSTVLGGVRVHAIELAENTIFNGLVTVARRQIGGMRFCSVPSDSQTPRRYNCQPDLATAGLSDEEAQRAAASVQPIFESQRYGSPLYCRLTARCPAAIRRGADDESEMGVFHDLFLPQREANLRARIDEYTLAGMDTGIIFVR